jgi:hypothetical protein
MEKSNLFAHQQSAYHPASIHSFREHSVRIPSQTMTSPNDHSAQCTRITSTISSHVNCVSYKTCQSNMWKVKNQEA